MLQDEKYEIITKNQDTGFYCLLDFWYQECVVDKLKPSTRRCYKLAIQHFKENGNDIKINNIKQRNLQDVLNKMAAKEYAKSTIDKVRVVCRSVINYAVENEILDKNPIVKLLIPKKATQKKSTL